MVLRSNWVLGEVGQPGAERAYRRAKSRSAPLKDITNAAIHNAEACRPPLPPARDSVMAVSAIGREAKVDPQQPLPKRAAAASSAWESVQQAKRPRMTPTPTKAGNTRRRPRAEDFREEETAALGDVWLTTSQEEDIKHAGAARRAAAAADALCPSGSSDSSVGKPDSNDDPDSSYRSPGVQWEQDTPAVTPDSPFPPDQQHPSPVPCGGSPLDDLCYGLTTVDVEPFLGSGGRRQLEHRTEQTAYVGTSAPSDKFTAATRQLLIDWAMLRQNRLRLSDSTLHLAIHLADELLALQGSENFLKNDTNVTRPEARLCTSCCGDFPSACLPSGFVPLEGSNYHLQAPPFPLKLCRLVVTCLFVAAKLLEPQTRCPRAQEFAKEAASDHLGFGPQQLLVAEAFLLKVLNYSIIRPTSSCFVGAFFSGLRKGVASDGIRKGLRRAAGLAPKPPKKKFGSGLDNATLAERLDVARYLLDIALHSHATLKMQRSELAAAAFWLACSAACEGRAAAKLTKQQFERLTGYRVRDISPYAEFLASLFRDAQKYPHLYVHRKHSRTRECAASLLHVKPS